MTVFKFKYFLFFILFFSFLLFLSDTFFKKNKKGNVIFIHPDGMSLSHWDAIRLIKSGSKGLLNFDQLPHTGIYRGTIRDQITATSNAGGTIHAYGIKTGKHSFGMDQGQPILSKSGKPHSILISAMKKGMNVALVQSGVLVEPGTAAFVSQVKSRKTQKDEIAKQLIQSGLNLIFAGGEKYLLPRGVQGHFGRGARKDRLNLVKWAKNHGYKVIYNLNHFQSMISKSKKILGIFAHDDTYNDKKSRFFKNTNLDYYQKSSPTIEEMTRKALDFLKAKGKPFFIVIEEEGTDNFSNLNNTQGFFEAGIRADNAIGVARNFLKKHADTLLLVTSDSNAGGLIITNPQLTNNKEEIFYSKTNGGVSYPFSILWPTTKDVHGGVLVKAEGLHSKKVKGVIENTQIYDLIYETLFGKKSNE